jgi:hypothetical protein
MTVDPTMLEAALRSHLNIIAPRTMVVLEKLKVNLVNFDGGAKTVSVPDFPESPEKSSHNVAFSRLIGRSHVVSSKPWSFLTFFKIFIQCHLY